MKLKLLTCIYFLFFVACGGHVQQKKEDGKITGLTETESFNSFFKKFNTDSTFQVSRVIFPFKIVQTADEGEEDQNVFINKKDWQKIELNYPEDKTYILTQTTISDTEVNVLLQVEDTGIHVEHVFKKQDGIWFLSYVLDGST